MDITNLIVIPEYIITLPLSKKEIKFRPFLVKEQRLLLQAQEEKNDKQTVNAIVSILKSCTFGAIDIETLNITDFEFLLLNVRSRSAGSNVNLNVKCKHCQTSNEVNFSINDLTLTENASVANPVEISEGFFIEMVYPSAATILKFSRSNKEEQTINIVKSCLKSIIHGESVYLLENQTSEQITKFIDELSADQLEKMIKFIESMNTNYLPVEFDCQACHENNKVRFEGLLELFT